MIKKFIIKLVNWKTREKLSATRFHSDQQDQDKLARERHDQIMKSRGERKYVSETTVPTDQEILGPSEPKPEESHE